MRCVRQERRIPQEKRLLLSDCVIDEIRYRFHSLTAYFQTSIAVATTAFRIAVGHPVREPAILERTLPPLSRLVREVTI